MLIKRIRDLREDHDLTQKDVAEFLKISPHTYGNYELGIRGIPLEYLIELAGFYKTSVDYLLGITNQKKPYPRISQKRT